MIIFQAAMSAAGRRGKSLGDLFQRSVGHFRTYDDMLQALQVSLPGDHPDITAIHAVLPLLNDLAAEEKAARMRVELLKFEGMLLLSPRTARARMIFCPGSALLI